MSNNQSTSDGNVIEHLRDQFTSGRMISESQQAIEYFYNNKKRVLTQVNPDGVDLFALVLYVCKIHSQRAVNRSFLVMLGKINGENPGDTSIDIKIRDPASRNFGETNEHQPPINEETKTFHQFNIYFMSGPIPEVTQLKEGQFVMLRNITVSRGKDDSDKIFVNVSHIDPGDRVSSIMMYHFLVERDFVTTHFEPVFDESYSYPLIFHISPEYEQEVRQDTIIHANIDSGSENLIVKGKTEELRALKLNLIVTQTVSLPCENPATTPDQVPTVAESILVQLIAFEECLSPFMIEDHAAWAAIMPSIVPHLRFILVARGSYDKSIRMDVNARKDPCFKFGIAASASLTMFDAVENYRRIGIPVTRRYIDQTFQNMANSINYPSKGGETVNSPAIVCLNEIQGSYRSLLDGNNVEFRVITDKISLQQKTLTEISKLTAFDGDILLGPYQILQQEKKKRLPTDPINQIEIPMVITKKYCFAIFLDRIPKKGEYPRSLIDWAQNGVPCKTIPALIPHEEFSPCINPLTNDDLDSNQQPKRTRV